MEKFLAAAIQTNSQPDVDHNLDHVYSLLKKAKERDIRFAALPENFAFLGDMDKRIENAEKIYASAIDFLKQVSEEFRIYLLGGSIPAPAPKGKIYNRSILFSPDGEVLSKYDKIHLFDVDLPAGESYRESDIVMPGKNGAVVYSDSKIGTIGLSICYDLRFPELYRAHSEKNTGLICIPSAFTVTTGKAHWHTLVKARAIENTSYVIAPAQTGTHGKNRKTYGHSLIIDPWGRILAEADENPCVIWAEVNPESIREVRTQIPSLNHRVL